MPAEDCISVQHRWHRGQQRRCWTTAVQAVAAMLLFAIASSWLGAVRIRFRQWM